MFLQNGKALMQHGTSLTEQSKFEAEAERARSMPSIETRAFPLQLAGFDRALVKQWFTSGTFEGNFGHEVEIVFSFQPCKSMAVNAVEVLVCTDQPSAVPTVVSKRISLIGGQKLSIPLPKGVEWRYEVLDQTSPIADE